MNPYKLFLKKNSIKQVDLARFLGVSEPSVSNVLRGKGNFSEENLSKIIDNDKEWDVSMLIPLYEMFSVGSGASGVVISGYNSINNSPIDNRHYYSDSPDVLKAQIDLLDERLKEKDAQIKEKDAQIKEKDAQIKQLLDILAKK